MKRLPSQIKFSLNDLKALNPSLSDMFFWEENTWNYTDINCNKIRLHIGCGEKIIESFVNIDFIPSLPQVLKWNLLNMWPIYLNNKVEMAFSEDVFEHFFLNEQLYILCSMNLVLKENGVFRLLMPDLDKLVNYSLNFFSKDMDDSFLKSMGVRTGADALNFGMRFSGHRWLHNEESLYLLSKACGFNRVVTECSKSTIQEMDNLNIRDESNSLSFANDLVKEKCINKWTVHPTCVVNSTLIEQVSADCYLYKSDNNDPQVEYNLPNELNAEKIILMNFRGTNLSEFNEHSYAKVYLKLDESKAIYFDSSLRSSYSCNLLSSTQINSKLNQGENIKMLRFDPAEKSNEYFTVGPLEIFFK